MAFKMKGFSGFKHTKGNKHNEIHGPGHKDHSRSRKVSINPMTEKEKSAFPIKMENNRDIAVDKNRAEFLKSLNITQADVNKYAESKGIDMAEVPSREEYMKIARKAAKAKSKTYSDAGEPGLKRPN